LDHVPAVAFITLGCPKNEVDTDRMRAAVDASAFALAEQPEAADIVIVNTCAFIQEAVEESIAVILDLVGDWLPKDPRHALVVAGCLPSRYRKDLTDELPEVTAFLPVAEESSLLATLERITGASAGKDDEQGRGRTCRETRRTATRTLSGSSAYLQVSDGCHRACTYCTIPQIRGPYVSTPLESIAEEARELVDLGAREIVLVGQDITAWGRDLEGNETIADVVRAVAAVPGVDWLRLMYVQPDGVTDDLLGAIADNPNVCRYLDIPLQHASSCVVRSMGRQGDSDAFLALLARIRAALPDVVLRTTLIAGFPGETRADVSELHAFVRAARFDYVGVFAYSPEESTRAAELPSPVPSRTKRARFQRLRDLADEISFAEVTERVGTKLEVLVEGTDEDGRIVGRWRGQAPEIDGTVVLDRGTAGDIVMTRIVGSLGYDLEGEVI
jgi:ribosomal protein S12 methylthiotransferase